MKRKVLMLSLTVALVAILALSATLAYFTDTDKETNSFTIGDVEIDLVEEFEQGANLTPGVGTRDPETGVVEIANTVSKVVNVENIGDNDAYVRVHIAIPAFQVDGVNVNVINPVCDDMSTVNGQWIWGKTLDSNYPPRDGGEWNQTRDFTINGIPYKAFCVTYESILAPDETTTTDAMYKVYMQSEISNEDIKGWDALYGDGNWEKVYVYAEGVQAEGFSDAITALNTAFGEPSSEYYQNLDWTVAAQG